MAEENTARDSDGIDPENLDDVADRLEAALERIVRHMDGPRSAPPSAELAARLDGLIGRLRDALTRPPSG
jgi:hypothetical protein